MSCKDVRCRLSEYVDGELDTFTRAQVLSHLYACEDCRRELHYLEQTVSLLKGVEAVSPPADIVGRVRTRIAGESKRADSRGVWYFLSTPQFRAAAAACLVLGICTYGLIHFDAADPASQADKLAVVVPPAESLDQAAPRDAGSVSTVRDGRVSTSDGLKADEPVRPLASAAPVAAESTAHTMARAAEGKVGDVTHVDKMQPQTVAKSKDRISAVEKPDEPGGVALANRKTTAGPRAARQQDTATVRIADANSGAGLEELAAEKRPAAVAPASAAAMEAQADADKMRGASVAGAEELAFASKKTRGDEPSPKKDEPAAESAASAKLASGRPAARERAEVSSVGQRTGLYEGNEYRELERKQTAPRREAVARGTSQERGADDGLDSFVGRHRLVSVVASNDIAMRGVVKALEAFDRRPNRDSKGALKADASNTGGLGSAAGGQGSAGFTIRIRRGEYPGFVAELRKVGSVSERVMSLNAEDEPRAPVDTGRAGIASSGTVQITVELLDE